MAGLKYLKPTSDYLFYVDNAVVCPEGIGDASAAARIILPIAVYEKFIFVFPRL